MSDEIISDGTVTKKVIVESRQRLRGPDGRKEGAISLAEREPELMVHLTYRWALIRDDLKLMGLNDKQLGLIMQKIGVYMMESVTAMEQAKRMMWNDMLPQMGDEDDVQGE